MCEHKTEHMLALIVQCFGVNIALVPEGFKKSSRGTVTWTSEFIRFPKSLCTMQMYVRPEGSQSWSASATEVGVTAGTLPQLYVTSVGSGRHRQLSDFDDHLDDLTR